jgi:hypothetical protein
MDFDCVCGSARKVYQYGKLKVKLRSSFCRAQTAIEALYVRNIKKRIEMLIFLCNNSSGKFSFLNMLLHLEDTFVWIISTGSQCLRVF